MTEDKSPRDKPSIRIIPPKLYGAFLLGGIVLNFIFPLCLIDYWGGFFLGFFLTCGAAVLLKWSFGALARAKTDFRIDRPASCIVKTGPYAFSRNPIYLGFNILYVGIALIFGSGWALLGLAPLLYILHTKVILKEEEYLAGKFGQDYLAYKSKVRRWL
jgi:protein-S-isoprenylcysteine O-methyltransferase Ste14